MKKDKEKKEQSHLFLKICFAVGLVLLILAIGVVFGNFLSESKKGKYPIAGEVDKYAEDQPFEEMNDNVSIAIPGYDIFEFESNKVKQNIVLFNPKTNTCYFKMTIILEDGTEIWSSELLKPGMSYTSINLEKVLEVGVYNNVQVRYECFSLSGLKPLNGATINVTIVVK